jgi:hypothetical protein
MLRKAGFGDRPCRPHHALPDGRGRPISEINLHQPNRRVWLEDEIVAWQTAVDSSIRIGAEAVSGDHKGKIDKPTTTPAGMYVIRPTIALSPYVAECFHDA